MVVLLGSSTNLIIGIKAVAFCTTKTKNKDYFTHKAGMAFAMYWVLYSSFCEFLMDMLQIYMGNGCSIGGLGVFICNFVGTFIESAVLLLTIKYYNKQSNGLLFSSRLIRWNLVAFCLYGVQYLIPIIYLVSHPTKNGVCFASTKK